MRDDISIYNVTLISQIFSCILDDNLYVLKKVFESAVFGVYATTIPVEVNNFDIET